ncbi:hypothetical protein C2E23DRAFT_888087 [Lenzites betulinus]|nr:hypothetical protein C2E23DRAFT_888087 [Lenzites betulinus]
MDAEGLVASPNTSTSFIRVISLSIAFYDYILTLPAEWRFYRSQRAWRPSMGCLLFIAIRYSSIAVIVLSNVGYFGSFFTPASCARYFMAPPIFKVIQTMVSQLILGIRTVNISRRSTAVTWVLAVYFILCTAAQWFLNMYNRVPVQGRHNNCTAGNKPPVLTVWLYYLLSMSYDILTLGISSMYLISFSPNSGKMAHLRRIMLTDGLGYFVALTAVNIFNLILYRKQNETIQSSGVSLGYALTWIMCQRILIHLRDAAAAHNRTITTQLVVSRALPSAQSVAHAMRSQFESKERAHRRHHRHHAAHGQTLSSAFEVDSDDVDWSYTSHSRARVGDLERSVQSVRSCGCSCDCGWGSEPSRGRSRSRSRQPRSREREASGSGVGPVASATLASGTGSTVHTGRSQRVRHGGPGHLSPSREDDAEGASDGDERDEKGKGEVSDVRVQIEETVTVEVEYDPTTFARESYRTPRVLWEARGRGGRGAGQGQGEQARGGRDARGARRSKRTPDPT